MKLDIEREVVDGRPDDSSVRVYSPSEEYKNFVFLPIVKDVSFLVKDGRLNLDIPFNIHNHFINYKKVGVAISNIVIENVVAYENTDYIIRCHSGVICRDKEGRYYVEVRIFCTPKKLGTSRYSKMLKLYSLFESVKSLVNGND